MIYRRIFNRREACILCVSSMPSAVCDSFYGGGYQRVGTFARSAPIAQEPLDGRQRLRRGVVRASTARKVLSTRSVFIGGVLAKAPWRNAPLCRRKSHFSRQRKRDRHFGFFVEIGLPSKMQNPMFVWHRFDMIGITGFKDIEIISHTA